MRGSFSGVDAKSCFLCALLLCSAATLGQNQPQPLNHVVIPNPTPRPPDLKQALGDSPADQKKRATVSLQSQLRAREVWLESNQILLLAQQLQQEILSAKRSTSMAVNAAKVAKIEKLAQSVQQQVKMQ
jgi:hypothetical protein